MVVARSFLDALGEGELGAFLDRQRRQSLRELVCALPFAAQAHGLELRLAGESRQVDYLICLSDEEATRASIRALAEEPGGEASRLPYRPFMEAWVATGSRLRERFPVLWLEYDRPEEGAPSQPGIFIAPAGDLRSDAEQHVLAAALRTLFDDEGARARRRQLEGVLERLPHGARIRHIGAMPGRDPTLLRLVLEGLTEASLPPLLRGIGWPGDVEVCCDLVGRAARRSGVFPHLVDIDFTGSVGPKLGVEFLLIGASGPRDEGRGLLAWLREEGWCTQEKHDALVPWLSWRTRDWPDMEPLTFWQKLYHLKLSMRDAVPRAPGRSLEVEAKGYWGVWSGPKADTLDELRRAFQAMTRGGKP
ncbi:hypothetical protein ACLESD_02515 [Pyxidicoccus sp. 3LFB2]